MNSILYSLNNVWKEKSSLINKATNLLVDEDDVDILDLAEDVEEAAGTSSDAAAAAAAEDTKEPQAAAAATAADTAAADADDDADDFPLLGKSNDFSCEPMKYYETNEYNNL